MEGVNSASTKSLYLCSGGFDKRPGDSRSDWVGLVGMWMDMGALLEMRVEKQRAQRQEKAHLRSQNAKRMFESSQRFERKTLV